MKKLSGILAMGLAAAMLALPGQKAQADDDFWWGLAAGVGVGVVGTTVYNDCRPVWRTPRCEPVYRRPVRTYHRPAVVYRDRPVYVEQPVYYRSEPDGAYVSYKEKRVWPFYKSVDYEVIPQLSQPNGRPQAVRLSDIRRTEQVRTVDEPVYEDAPQVEKSERTLRERVDETDEVPAQEVKFISVSNRAGAAADVPKTEQPEETFVRVSNRVSNRVADTMETPSGLLDT